jgi:hypothetical protein
MSWLNTSVSELSDRMWERPVVRALGTVLLFALVGPVIGGVAFGLLEAGVSVVRNGDFWGVAILSLIAMPVGLSMALVFAAIPAAIVGVFFATVDFARQRSSLGLAIVVGALGGWLWPLVWELPPSDLTSYNPTFIASVVSTVACWFISTRQARRSEAATP